MSDLNGWHMGVESVVDNKRLYRVIILIYLKTLNRLAKG